MKTRSYFDQTRVRLTSFLEDFFAGKRREVGFVKPWGRDVMDRLLPFTLGGKMIRGGLVCLGYEMAGRRLAGDPVRAGAALELVQSALLIHDDIMDRDALRRGAASLHQQYALKAGEEGFADPVRFGEGAGICAGEIALFLAFEILAGLRAPVRRRAAALEFFGREFVLVGLGQIQDLHASASPKPFGAKDILGLYRLKTARYSFSVPLVLGCLLAGGPAKLRAGLDEWGEILGLMFQLRDDDLGLFGSQAELGKPVGSDVRQGKRTLISVLLRRRVSPDEGAELDRIIGHPDASEQDIALIRVMAERAGVRREIDRLIGGYGRRAARLVEGLAVAERHKAVLRGLLDFSRTRRK